MRPVAGFTLIELMISAGVASIILIASYLCLSAGVASQKMIEPRTQALQSARVALAMMSADLRSACSLCPDYDFVGEQRTLGKMEADNLDFATHYYVPARPREGDYCQVSYYVDKSRGSEHFSLWRRRNPHLAVDPLNSGGTKEEIAPGLRGLRLEYYDGEEWYDNWGDATINKKVKYTTVQATNLVGFPQAVRITLLLELDAGKSAEKAEPPMAFQTVVRLECPTPNGASDNSMPAGGDNAAQPGQNPGGGN
jgi:prepilin-type N-terminal cleavage/methylation domain-containing protein